MYSNVTYSSSCTGVVERLKISIVSGAYNVESYYSLHKSIASVLNQTFTDFEFIICDDGSTDDTWRILNSYSKADSRIKLLRNDKNIGLAASLNKCIAVSSGEYIARHDLDDYNAPIRLEKQLRFMMEHEDVSLVGCQSFLFDQNGVWGKSKFPIEVVDKDFLFTSPYRHGSVMFRREALLEAGCYRVAKETYRTEDYDLFMTMQTFCKGANLDEYLYYFCEDESARKRRKYQYRIDEAKVRWIGFRKLRLLPLGLPYIIKPLLVGMIPEVLLEKLRQSRIERLTDDRVY